jgi:hypothetical protein
MIAEPLIASHPPLTSPAPIRPPISAWLDEEGSPTAQVARFHAIAPTSAAKIVCRSSAPASTMPDEIVVATLIETNAPTKFNTPHSATAAFGLRARVAIDVAIAFAVSWKPFVKSNAIAVCRAWRAGTRTERHEETPMTYRLDFNEPPQTSLRRYATERIARRRLELVA